MKVAKSPYLFHDHIVTDVARLYSNELHQPFRVMVGDFSGYDLASEDGKILVEVKLETTPMRTGNVAIEYWNTDLDQPSGILGSTATLWLHIIPEINSFVAYEFNVPKLQRLTIEEGKVKSNGRNALCKIIPLDIFKKHAQRCFPFELHFSQN